MIHVQNQKFWNSTSLHNSKDKQNQRPFISKQAQKELSNDWMYIDNGKYNTENWIGVFEKMKNSKAKRLILEKNDRPSLIQQLSVINFTNLTVLNLKSNKITSIQGFSSINCPNLQWLYLGNFFSNFYRFLFDYSDNNHIISLQPLVKNKLTQLKKLHFSKLLIKEDENLIKQIPTRIGYGKCFLSFEGEISSMNKISQEDLSFVIKMNCLTIRSISKFRLIKAFCGKKRIKQKKVYEAIENRFNYIHFYDSHLEMVYNRPMFF